MNTRSTKFEFICEPQQVNELVSALFHSILFHRTYGKFNYQKDGTFSISNIGYEEVDCDFINTTYVRCNSYSLASSISKEIVEFSTILKDSKTRRGTITLEFFSKGNKLLPLLQFNENSFIWEQWELKINCDIKRNNVNQSVEDALLEKLMTVISVINSSKYVPEMPPEHLVETIFDNSHSQILPYLHKIYFKIDDPDSASSNAQGNIDGTFKQFIKEIIK